MTIHIGENTQYVQMPAAYSIDSEAEMAVSNSAPARYRDMSKLNRLIEAHKITVKEREDALEALNVAEIKQHDLGGTNEPLRVGRPFFPVLEFRVTEHQNQRDEVIERILAEYNKLAECRGVFSCRESYLSNLERVKDEAVQRAHEICERLQARNIECGMDSANSEIHRTYKNEDAAVTAILAYRAETAEEGELKGDYIRTTWWYGETKDDGEILEHHLEAMMQGMGCGVAS